jgi:hypothetical protein
MFNLIFVLQKKNKFRKNKIKINKNYETEKTASDQKKIANNKKSSGYSSSNLCTA